MMKEFADYLGYMNSAFTSYRGRCVSWLLHYCPLYPAVLNTLSGTSVMYTFALCGTVVVCYKLYGAWYFDQQGVLWYDMGQSLEVRLRAIRGKIEGN